jgi:DNA-binding GntR family transcriptional regulator
MQTTDGDDRMLRKLEGPPSLANLAYKRLHEAILNSELESGKIYVETKLARQLGISRTPVREALLELSSQGLVRFISRKGIQIIHFTERAAEHVFELREAIELAVIDSLSRKTSNLDFSKVEKAYKAQEKACMKEDRDAFLVADRLFHISLAEMTGNSLFVSILNNLRDKIHIMAAEALKQRRRMEEVLNEHQDIMEYLRSEKQEKAREAMRFHLELSHNAVFGLKLMREMQP